MKEDVFNKATKFSKNITMLNQVLNSSYDLKHINYKGLFCSSLLTLMDDSDFKEHFASFLKNEIKMNKELFENL